MTRKTFSASFKAKAALEAIRGDKTLNEIASAYGIHPNQLGQWKWQALEGLPEVFTDGRSKRVKDHADERDRLYQQIGKLQYELDWLKKRPASASEARNGFIEREHPTIPIARQCALLDVNRSGYYYQPQPPDELNLLLLRRIDEQYTQTPFYGIRKMTAWLRQQGFPVNPKRVSRLMRNLGLQAIFTGPNTSRKHPDHRIFPYLLRGVEIVAPDQVWSTDITYIRMQSGVLYLTAVIDWFSRYVLAWRLSNTLDNLFCIEALESALAGGRPAIFNSDQGTQFTSLDFIRVLEDAGVQISMDGRGRALDNVFVERLWRSVKYEEVYLRDYRTPREARLGLGSYFDFYNSERLHQSLGYHTPAAVYLSR